MKDQSKVKFVSDVDTPDDKMRAKSPFKVHTANQRRFVRLQISTPMSLKRIKDIFGNFWPGDEAYVLDGTVLNISAGGVLVETDQPLNEGDIVAMRFRLQEIEDLDNVLGVVKRSEPDDDCCLTGIEFITREWLADKLSNAEMQLLSDRLGDFQSSVQHVLQKYLYRQEDARHA